MTVFARWKRAGAQTKAFVLASVLGLNGAGLAGHTFPHSTDSVFPLRQVSHCDEILTAEEEASADRAERWERVWNRDRKTRALGFHRQRYNQFLTRYYARLTQASGPSGEPDIPTVFVPLCGKTKDMMYLLSNGANVVGVECVQRAIDELAEDEAFSWDSSGEPVLGASSVSTPFTVFSKTFPQKQVPPQKLEIWKGDFVELDNSHLQVLQESVSAPGNVSGYDRAALVAIQPVLRQRYAEIMTQVCDRILLVTLEYPQQEKEGPPFSVSQEEVLQLYGEDYDVELLERVYALDSTYAKWQDTLSELYLNVFLLKKKHSKSVNESGEDSESSVSSKAV